eukprot:Cvel_31819.t1-p1 / transcript=Cvel_31819.t1 / gene=Cvel_31819 / organism=Chromera_velia_CCMP2878 / gene_product=hypothetical protein / transcript_product=hypothetical protein / location=Cvel_scaffold4809:5945-7032(+) / protein_length=243 / sequence_SO=supercontig / SO=protein_coding / is_pseudo=false
MFGIVTTYLLTTLLSALILFFFLYWAYVLAFLATRIFNSLFSGASMHLKMVALHTSILRGRVVLLGLRITKPGHSIVIRRLEICCRYWRWSVYRPNNPKTFGKPHRLDVKVEGLEILYYASPEKYEKIDKASQTKRGLVKERDKSTFKSSTKRTTFVGPGGAGGRMATSAEQEGQTQQQGAKKMAGKEEGLPRIFRAFTSIKVTLETICLKVGNPMIPSVLVGESEKVSVVLSAVDTSGSHSQ